jgi:hypothetical protein
MTKKLELGSKYEEYDYDQDGIVTDAEMKRAESIVKLENQDKKEDAQRNMAWFALYGMLVYPLIAVITAALGLDPSILTSMADIYFISSAGIIAAFFGKEAYMSKHNSSI